jgi:hypothetical protein
VIAILDDKDAFKPVLNPAEVEEIFDAPLEMFLKVFFSDVVCEKSMLISIFWISSTIRIAFFAFLFRRRTRDQRNKNGWELNTSCITSIIRRRIKLF